ncbi:MipA/OmpV family protein [Camelimonas lactis]|uniref:Outer membrane scaffolding protein for murein synthesis (MipA/OmpV family) n=1 Tax=Camelimonas lactis TaxID=659006 RepID=A0A4V2RWL2_9HYPH|nr:MipA/OmpV family protein [Camelimonas lactis]TCO09015.1 outer membrane scaffolding protein for murein synthesis (MipA/OmpV family) [Camelimonas lactis]
MPAVFAGGVQAQPADYGERSDIMFNNTPVSSDQWIVTVKGTIGVSSAWPGSDRMTFFGSPSISYRYMGERPKFTSPDDSASLSLYDTSWLRAGVVAGYGPGRYSGSERRLWGIHDAGWSVQPGVFLDLWPTEFLRARIEARYAVGNVHGFVGSVGLDFVKSFDRLTLAVGPRLKWGSNRYNDNMFGVRFEDALMTAGFVQPFKARGGINSLGVVASASYTWSDELTTTVFGGYDRLMGDAGDSPIVQRVGSRNQYTAGVSAAYSFNMRALW